MDIHIPQNIKYLLSVNNVSRNALAEICSVNPVTISHWTAGRQSPKIDQLMKISAHFEISLDDLVKRQLVKGYEQKSSSSEPKIQYSTRVNLLEEITAQMLSRLKDQEKRINILEQAS